ncbi:hypothetical protein MASR1M32_13940 [Rhodobacter sp.]
MREIESLIDPLRDTGEVKSTFAIVGQGGQDNRGFIVVTLADWAERSRGQDEIAAELQAKLRNVIGVRIFAMQPNSLGIRGAGQGLSFALVGDDYGKLAEVARDLVAQMEADPRYGAVSGLATTPPSRSCSSRSTAHGPRILASISTAWARPCRPCWTAAPWAPCSSRTTASTSVWSRPPIR